MGRVMTPSPYGQRVVSVARLRMAPVWLRWLASYVAALALAALFCQASLVAARLPVRLEVGTQGGRFTADGSTLAVPWQRAPTGVYFADAGADVHEFQLDGSDSTNNFSLDPSYIAQVAGSPYYRFHAWMRDYATLAVWRDLAVRRAGEAQPVATRETPSGGGLIALPTNAQVTITASLLRPESPVHIYLLCGTSLCAEVIADRNDRYLLFHTLDANGLTVDEQRVYFPTQPGPFWGEIAYLLAHIVLWALFLLGALAGGLLVLRAGLLVLSVPMCRLRVGQVAALSAHGWRTGLLELLSRRAGGGIWEALAGLTALGALIGAVAIALAQYHAAPHILDASAYYFQAKIFASGRLSVPAPRPEVFANFQGPFMVVADGRWFSQYAPATSALLALGMLLRVPWVVEPLLGALALWGTYRIGRRLFGARTAYLALALGALSPFYLYLAAAYLSHTVALCFAVYFVLLLLRFEATHHPRDLVLAAACASGLLLTRELSAAVVCGLCSAYVLGTGWRALWSDRWRVLPGLLFASAILLGGLVLYLLYNRLQTGDPWVSPRMLFSPADRYGFGPGVGFYGRHTLAAGLVNVEQQLTILLIDLYGWPFYMTLALVPLALTRHWRALRWDLLCLLVAGGMIAAQVGYFYHGIYLGPRYLFEIVPFLLLLTARGAARLAELLAYLWRVLAREATLAQARAVAVTGTTALMAVLVLCNLLYYLPRQVQLHTNFSGLPASQPVDVAAIYAFRPAHALVLTDNGSLYAYVLWPLNDPDLHGETVYALASTADARTALRTLYPHRAVYQLRVASHGAVSFERLTP